MNIILDISNVAVISFSVVIIFISLLVTAYVINNY